MLSKSIKAYVGKDKEKAKAQYRESIDFLMALLSLLHLTKYNIFSTSRFADKAALYSSPLGYPAATNEITF